MTAQRYFFAEERHCLFGSMPASFLWALDIFPVGLEHQCNDAWGYHNVPAADLDR